MKFKIKRILAVMLVFCMMMGLVPNMLMTAHAASVADEIQFFKVNGEHINNVPGNLDFGSWSWNGDAKRLYLKDYNGSDIEFAAKPFDGAHLIDVYVSGDCVVNGDFEAPYSVASDLTCRGGLVRFYLKDGATLTINGELKCFDLEIHKMSGSTGAKATFTVNGGVNSYYNEHEINQNNVKISGNIVATFGNGTNAYGIQGRRGIDISDPVAVTVQGSTAAFGSYLTVYAPTSGYDVSTTTKRVVAKPVVTQAVSDLLAVGGSSVTLKVGETKGLALRVNPDDATNKNVTWKSSDPSVAKVTQTYNIDTNGIQLSEVTGLKAGTATITATADDGSGKSVSWTVTVKNSTAMPTISYDATNFTVTATGEGTVNLYKDGVAVSNPCVLTQTDSEQTYVFTATAQEDGKEISETVTKNVTVPAKVTITLDKTEVNVTTGWPLFAITATVTPADKTVTWSSDNESVATVNGNGVVTVHSAGTATITATVDGVSASCVVKVEPKTTITLDKTEVNVTTGWPLFAITATVTPADKTVTWSSDNESVATVDENGIVEVHSAGTATITATVDGVSASCVVNVTSATTYTVKAACIPLNGGTITGTGTYNEGASVTLTATPKEGYEFKCWMTGTEIELSTNATYTFTVNANTVLFALFEEAETPTYTVKAACIPSNGGTITGTGTYNEGASVTLTATPKEGYEFKCWMTGTEIELSTNATYTFTVNANTLLFALFEEAETPSCDHAQDKLTLTYEDGTGHWYVCECEEYTTQKVDHEFEDDADTTCDCGYVRTIETPEPECKHENMTLVYEDGTGHWSECTAEGCEYATEKVPHVFETDEDTTCECGYERDIVVPPVNPSVELNKDKLALVVPGSEKLTATVTPDGLEGYKLVWSSSDTSVATVDQNGNVTAVAAGTATITVELQVGTARTQLKDTCEVTVSLPADDDNSDDTDKPSDDNKDDESKPSDTNKPTTDTESPKTGDTSNIFMWFAVLFVSGFALVGFVLFGRKRRA